MTTPTDLRAGGSFSVKASTAGIVPGASYTVERGDTETGEKLTWVGIRPIINEVADIAIFYLPPIPAPRPGTEQFVKLAPEPPREITEPAKIAFVPEPMLGLREPDRPITARELAEMLLPYGDLPLKLHIDGPLRYEDSTIVMRDAVTVLRRNKQHTDFGDIDLCRLTVRMVDNA